VPTALDASWTDESQAAPKRGGFVVRALAAAAVLAIAVSIYQTYRAPRHPQSFSSTPVPPPSSTKRAVPGLSDPSATDGGSGRTNARKGERLAHPAIDG